MRGIYDHAMTSRVVDPPGLAPPAANYAHAVLTENAQRWLHTAGVVGTRPDGSVPDDVGEQAEVMWQNVHAMLTDAAMDVTDIVSIITCVVANHDLGPVMAARDAYFNGHLAASVLLVVPHLAQPQWKVEVAVVAAR